MDRFQLMTDSGCDLPMSLCKERGIIPLQLSYEIDGVTYLDAMDHADCHRFYEWMREGKVPHTSQITPSQYLDFWKDALAQKDLPIVHISMGSGISGTYNNALIAKDQLLQEFPDALIDVVDSTLASVGYGMLALASADLRDQGKTPAECGAWLNAHKGEINTYYTTGDLSYLYRSGRVSRAGMVIAHALNIWPILNLDAGGHLIVQEKARGKKKTVQRIHQIIGELCPHPENQVLFICHSDIYAEAKEFGDGIQGQFGFKDVYYTYIGSTIGTHSGPGLMAAFFYGKPRTM
ncbi:MAG TPA: DegV family protein [Clostridiales bacterium]|nr:DegV family protein [Clostridiales bacterium]